MVVLLSNPRERYQQITYDEQTKEELNYFGIDYEESNREFLQ